MADDVGEEGLAIQAVLAELKSDGWLSAVLGEGQHHLVTLKVLKQREQVAKLFYSVMKSLPGILTNYT